MSLNELMFSHSLLPLGLVALVFSDGVFADREGDPESANWNCLNNNAGQDPCALKTFLQTNCSESTLAMLQAEQRTRRRRWVERRDSGSNDTGQGGPPPANNCTCNNVFFNLDGACLAMNGHNNWMRTYHNWTQSCQTNSLNFTIYAWNASVDTEQFPEWAYMDPPENNGTFDVTRALNAVNGGNASQSTWPRLLIILPIASAVGVFIICGFLWWCCRRRKRSNSKRGSYEPIPWKRKLMPGRARVKETKPDSSWTIEDQPGGTVVSHFSSPRSSRSNRGHMRLSSSPSRPSGGPETATPGREFMRNMKWLFTPWKPRPVRVMPARKDTDFDLDRSTKTDSTLENYRLAGFRESGLPMTSSQREFRRSQWSNRIQEDEEQSEDELDPLVLNQKYNALERERQAANEGAAGTDVIQIGRRSFTLESNETGVQVIPPSPQVLRAPPVPTPPPPSTQAPPPQTRERSGSRTIRTPPAPGYPAPLPPITPPRSPPQVRKPSIDPILDYPSAPPPAPSQVLQPQIQPLNIRRPSNERTPSRNANADTRNASISPRRPPLTLQSKPPSREKLNSPPVPPVPPHLGEASPPYSLAPLDLTPRPSAASTTSTGSHARGRRPLPQRPSIDGIVHSKSASEGVVGPLISPPFIDRQSNQALDSVAPIHRRYESENLNGIGSHQMPSPPLPQGGLLLSPANGGLFSENYSMSQDPGNYRPSRIVPALDEAVPPHATGPVDPSIFYTSSVRGQLTSSPPPDASRYQNYRPYS